MVGGSPVASGETLRFGPRAKKLRTLNHPIPCAMLTTNTTYGRPLTMTSVAYRDVLGRVSCERGERAEIACRHRHPTPCDREVSMILSKGILLSSAARRTLSSEPSKKHMTTSSSCMSMEPM